MNNLRITVGATVLTASLADNPTARDFAALLPLTLTLHDYADTEKITALPRRLSTGAALTGHLPSVGDITYYAPWGILVLFYQNFSYSSGLIHLGRLEAGIEALATAGAEKVPVRMERVS